MWTTIYFWGLTGIALLAWVLYFLPIWGIRGERRKGGVFLHRVGGHRLVGNQHRRRFSF